MNASKHLAPVGLILMHYKSKREAADSYWFAINRVSFQGRQCGSVVEPVPGMYRILDLIPSTRGKNDRKCSKIFKMILVLFGKCFSVWMELQTRRDVGGEALHDLT